MKKNTKIALIVVSSVLVLGGLGTWLYLRNKKKKEGESDSGLLDEGNSTGGSTTSYTPPSSSSSSTSSGGGVSGGATTAYPIQKGSRGDKVESLQRMLICVGNLPKGSDDGIWGNQTDGAMKKSPVKMSVIKNKQDFDVAMGRMYGQTMGGTSCK